MPRSETVIRNANYRYPITVITEYPDLDAHGRAGARLKLDLMLSAPEGVTEQQLEALSIDEREVLRKMAAEPDPKHGVPRQTAAIGALSQLRDRDSLLQVADLARDSGLDRRVRIAATHALGEIGGPQVAPVLHGLLDADLSAVRAQAARGLARVGGVADIAAIDLVAESDDAIASSAAASAAAALRSRLDIQD